MIRHNLVLIYPGPDYERDFDEIARKVFALDEDITVYYLPANSAEQLPEAVWRWPTLVVALTPRFNLRIKRGTVLRNQQIGKIGQAKVFRGAGIATPAVADFSFGKKLDPIIFGEFVLIKPKSLGLTSYGQGVQVFRRRQLEQLGPGDFPANHLIHRDRNGYLVQKFIYTGEYPSIYRVATFLGEVLYVMKYRSLEASPSLSAADAVIAGGMFTQKGQRDYVMVEYPEAVALGRHIAQAFAKVPLLGIDLLAEAESQKLYALEVNAGGNTWHFSSQMWAERRAQFPELARAMKEQYAAFDTAARALVAKTRELAS